MGKTYKEFIVTTIDKVRSTYIVTATDEESARRIMENNEGESYELDTEEFYDRDSIESIVENK